MKLRRRFSIIALVCAIEMFILATLTMIGASFVQRLQNFQFLEQECQFDVADMINYLNQTVYYGVDTPQASTTWKSKLVSTNKKFHEFTGYGGLKYFSEDFRTEVENANSIWTKVVNQVNPFNIHFQNIQKATINEEERNFISRNGIKAAVGHYEDSEAVQAIGNSTLLIENQMKALIQNSNALRDIMEKINVMLSESVQHYTNLYRIGVFLLGGIFSVIVLVSIFYGTTIVIKNIGRVRDMSQLLSEKDFTTKIVPQGSNEMQDLMNNMNNMVKEINDFFIVVKKTAAKAISSGYSINDSSSSTAAATNEINLNIENITDEFEQITKSIARSVEAVNQINVQVKTLVQDNNHQVSAINESTDAVANMIHGIEQIKENAVTRSKIAEEMSVFVADGDAKIAATNKILGEVMNQLDQIKEIVTIINSVSAQTNLLSMNAAIESAHAGEYGKGFAVVAEEIRSLAISTANNAKKITESIKGTIEAVTEANRSSLLASEAFAKVSSHSNEMISAFSAITEEIENINGQTKHITEKTGITATTADKINHYCENLAQNQETVASEISSVNGLFNKAFEEIKEINAGTEEIVKRMAAVGSLSKESYKNMTELENVLEKFKTTSDESEEVQKEIENSTIENIISPELQAQLEADFGNEVNSGSDVEFDPSSVVDESFGNSENDENVAEKTEDSDFDEMFENIPDENQ